MSRVGKLPVEIPGSVTVAIESGQISVTGPKGTLTQFAMPGVSVKQEGNTLVVQRDNDDPKNRSKHGLMRALLQNMITGVTDGYDKKLELAGVGYRMNLSGSDLKLGLGFSHEVVYKLPEGVTATVDQNTLTISGPSKQQVGQVAAEIRALKKPEPYKGKGISYQGERILRKSGKSGKEKA
jgi:large subunit ribosomal protein L6